VRWRSLCRSTFLGKRCTSHNTPPTSRKRAAYCWSLRNFLPPSSLFMVGKAQKSNGARSELNSVFGLEKVDQWNSIRTVQTSYHAIYGLFQLWKGSSEARNFEMINSLQHVFEKKVERCKKCIACEGRYFRKRTSPHLHKVPTRNTTVSPRTLQAALVNPSICIVLLRSRTLIANLPESLKISKQTRHEIIQRSGYRARACGLMVISRNEKLWEDTTSEVP
jgi:hypothetical protein